jgi:hypothetical protein
MQRGSDKHSPRVDDELEHEMEGAIRANRPTRAQESRDAEPPADDDTRQFGPRDPQSTEPGPAET